MFICINLTPDTITLINAIGTLASPIVAIVAIIASFTLLKKQLKSSDVALKKQLDDSHIQLKLQLQSANDALIKQLESSNIETKSTTELACFNSYIEITRKYTEESYKEHPDFRDYCRELLDLMYVQYHLWLNKHISFSMMETWCISRRKNYNNKIDYLYPIYKESWDGLMETDYFPDEKFKEFMKDIHDKSKGSIKEVLTKHKLDPQD